MNTKQNQIETWLKEVFAEFMQKLTLYGISDINTNIKNNLEIEYLSYLLKCRFIREGIMDAEHEEENDFTDYSNSDKTSDAFIRLVAIYEIMANNKSVYHFRPNENNLVKNVLKELEERFLIASEMFSHLCCTVNNNFDLEKETNKFIEKNLEKNQFKNRKRYKCR